MPQRISKWNKKTVKWLWGFVIIGLISSIPLLWQRIKTEQSANTFTVVMDYNDLLSIAQTQSDREHFLQDSLHRLQSAGVNGFTVSESNLEELNAAGEINVYDSSSAALLRQAVADPKDNSTYVLFNRPESAAILKKMIKQGFSELGSQVTNWEFEKKSGLRIEMNHEDAMMRPLSPNPFAIQMLNDYGFNVFPRLSNRMEKFDLRKMDQQLQSFAKHNLNFITFRGSAVTGFQEGKKEQENVKRFAGLLKKHNIGVVLFENLKVPMKGINFLINALDYKAIRGHAVSAAEMQNLTVAFRPTFSIDGANGEGEEELSLEDSVLFDRLQLAVKERNIRFLYLHAASNVDEMQGKITQPLDHIIHILQGKKEGSPDGLIQKLQSSGFHLGIPQQFQVTPLPLKGILDGIVRVGAVSLIALMVACYFPSLLSLIFLVGLFGIAGLNFLNPQLSSQLLALLTAISGPTLAGVWIVKKVNAIRISNPLAKNSVRLIKTLVLFITTSLISLLAVPFMISLLNDIPYFLVLQQFRGVSLLHLLPLLLVAIYIFLYQPSGNILDNAKKILSTPITVFWVVALGFLGIVCIYYLTRTGNSGQVSSWEMKFRALMENLFGVRPRTKEFLLGHPLLFLSIFLALRDRRANFLLIFGVVGQLSMVDTFAHVHTPVFISGTRTFIGWSLGLGLGVLGVICWQILSGIWNKTLYRKRS